MHGWKSLAVKLPPSKETDVVRNFECLFAESPLDSVGLTPMEQIYGTPLVFPTAKSPYVIANMVSTIDGIASMKEKGLKGAASVVSCGSVEDRLLMALLRTHADVILIGAQTLRADGNHDWTAPALIAQYADALIQLRLKLKGSQQQATLVVVSQSGKLPFSHPALGNPSAIIVTESKNQTAITSRLPHLKVITMDTAHQQPFDMKTVVAKVSEFTKAKLILCEGGPHLLGQMLSDRLVDELFLTVAPHIAGRSTTVPRIGLIEGVTFTHDVAPHTQLLSSHRVQDHLFLRYKIK